MAERVIKAIALAKEKGYAWFTQSSEEQIREQAKASAERWAAGKPLSCLDGKRHKLCLALDQYKLAWKTKPLEVRYEYVVFSAGGMCRQLTQMDVDQSQCTCGPVSLQVCRSL